MAPRSRQPQLEHPHGTTLPENRRRIPLPRNPAGYHDGHFSEFCPGPGACAPAAARLGHSRPGRRGLSPASVGRQDPTGEAALLDPQPCPAPFMVGLSFFLTGHAFAMGFVVVPALLVL